LLALKLKPNFANILFYATSTGSKGIMVMQQEDQFRSVDSTKPLKTVKQLKCIYGMIQNRVELLPIIYRFTGKLFLPFYW
jgi:hypothetical protein